MDPRVSRVEFVVARTVELQRGFFFRYVHHGGGDPDKWEGIS